MRRSVLWFCGLALVCCAWLVAIVLYRSSGPSDEDAASTDTNMGQPMREIEADPELMFGAPPGDEGRTATKPLGVRPHEIPSSPQTHAAEQVARMGEAELLEAVSSTNQWIKLAAAFAISRNPTPTLVSALIQETSRCPDAFTRSRMRAAIAGINSEDCISELLKRVGTKPDRDIQEAVRTALLRSGSPAVVDALMAHAEAAEDNDYLWREVGRILASIRNPQSVPQLLDGLASTNQAIVAGCSLALAAIGAPEGIQGLLGQLANSEGADSVILADAISKTRSPAALPVLTSLLTGQTSNANSNAKLAALRALANFSVEQRTPILQQFLMSETDAQLRAEAQKLLNN